MTDTLAIQHVKAISGIGKKILRSRKHAAAELRVIDAERIGHDQMRPAIDGHPIRQLIVIGVGVVEKASFLNEETPDAVRAAFGGNYDRLAALKAKYDPTNFFSINQNVKPARAAAASRSA